MSFHVISCHFMSFHVISGFMSFHVSCVIGLFRPAFDKVGRGRGKGGGQICLPKPSAIALLLGKRQKQWSGSWDNFLQWRNKLTEGGGEKVKTNI
jgi:hypothetical protein